MSKQAGGSKKQRLADMTCVPPDDPPYELPPPEECDESVGPVVLARNHELRARYLLWKETYLVEFAIVQIVRVGGEWREVARIDTEHGTVHKHQLKRSAPEDTVGIREQLASIPAVGGWEVVDRWYDEALKLMQTDWRDNYRRWGGDDIA